MSRRILSVVLIFAGLCVISYPKISEMYHDYQQQRLIEKWQQSLMILEDEFTSIEQEDISIDNGQIEGEENPTEKYIKENMEGMLYINKINLSLPILRGVTERNLNISVARVESPIKAGEVGNYCLAGHRSHTYGRIFNRLDELKAGDMIEVEDGEKRHKYTVMEKIYVKPEDTWVLNGNKEDKEITLITCHPMIKPTQRLIIKGKIVD